MTRLAQNCSSFKNSVHLYCDNGVPITTVLMEALVSTGAFLQYMHIEHTFKTSTSGRCAKVPQQWVFAVMGSLAMSNILAMRVSMSLTMAEMVTTTEKPSNGTNSNDTCPATESTSSRLSRGDVYDWDHYKQGLILSSFYWGFIVTQIPSGILAEKFGGKYIVGLGILSSSIFTLLTPKVVQAYEVTGLIILRILIGLGHGTTFPAINVLIARWAPPHERPVINTVVMTGQQTGIILGSGLSGLLYKYTSTGWPMVSYVLGTFGVLWFLAWVVLCYDKPDVHPFITENEREHLHVTIGEHNYKRTGQIPWWYILTSVPMWALIAARSGTDWCLFTMISDLPLYMRKVLKVSPQENGFLTAFPYLSMALGGIASSCLANWVIKTDKISKTNVRKILNTVGAVGPALFIIAASYAGCHQTAAVILLTSGMGLMGCYYPSIVVNAFDLSPNYSGTLMTILSITTTSAGIAIPSLVGILTPNQTLSEWRIVFWITFVILIVSSLIFNIWGDAEVQHWNDPDLRVHKRNELENEKHDTMDLSLRPCQ